MGTHQVAFEKWALSHTGYEGGDLSEGGIWFCGIEWGGAYKCIDHFLQDLDLGPREDIPFINDANPNLPEKEPFTRILFALYRNLNAVRLMGSAEVVSDVKGHMFTKDSKTLKLNLFPVAQRRVDAKHWEPFAAITGLNTKREYWKWCVEKRFPGFREMVRTGSPSLIICTGHSYAREYLQAFGNACLDPSMPTRSTVVCSGTRNHPAYFYRGEVTSVFVVPFFGVPFFGGLEKMELTTASLAKWMIQCLDAK